MQTLSSEEQWPHYPKSVIPVLPHPAVLPVMSLLVHTPPLLPCSPLESHPVDPGKPDPLRIMEPQNH